MQAEIRILIWINRCLRFLQTLDIYTAHCSSASGRSRKPACWRSPPVHHVFLATGATGGVEVEGGGRLNAAENTSFHSAVRRSPNFCRDRGMAECRNVSKSLKTNTCIIDNKCSIFTVYISLKGE